MKPNMIVGALALTSVFMAGHLQAADGTVHFRGEIIDSTCEVTPETKDQVVDLGKVNRTAFSGVDDVAAPTAFSIDLTQCPETFKSAAIRFDGNEDAHGNGNRQSVPRLITLTMLPLVLARVITVGIILVRVPLVQRKA